MNSTDQLVELSSLAKTGNPTETYSLVIPVYGNEEGIADLLNAVDGIATALGHDFEAIFVVDGSPDQSGQLLIAMLPEQSFKSQLIFLSRNFGAFYAIRVGLQGSNSRVTGVMAADLQEPSALVLDLMQAVAAGNCDVALGKRVSRDDPAISQAFSSIFWRSYRRLVNPDIPAGGVDIFALSNSFKMQLLKLSESNSSLLAQIFWLGGRRQFIEYSRKRRDKGRSAWTLSKKFRYLSDSVFAFTDLPIRLLLSLGATGLIVSIIMGLVTAIARLIGIVEVPGYSTTIVLVIFFGALNCFGLGIIGTYAWRTFENSKARPLAVIQERLFFQPSSQCSIEINAN